MGNRVVLAGRLDRRDSPLPSLSLSLDFAGGSESVLVFGRGLLIDVEILMLAEDLVKRRG